MSVNKQKEPKMPKGIYKRKKKAGRPKGSKNKKFSMAGLTNYKMSDVPEVGLMPTKSKWIAPKKSRYEKPHKIISDMQKALEDINSDNPESQITTWQRVTKPLNEPTEPPSFLSRIEAATVKYEQAINDVITALKGQ